MARSNPTSTKCRHRYIYIYIYIVRRFDREKKSRMAPWGRTVLSGRRCTVCSVVTTPTFEDICVLNLITISALLSDEDVCARNENTYPDAGDINLYRRGSVGSARWRERRADDSFHSVCLPSSPNNNCNNKTTTI